MVSPMQGFETLIEELFECHGLHEFSVAAARIADEQPLA